MIRPGVQISRYGNKPFCTFQSCQLRQASLPPRPAFSTSFHFSTLSLELLPRLPSRFPGSLLSQALLPLIDQAAAPCIQRLKLDFLTSSLHHNNTRKVTSRPHKTSSIQSTWTRTKIQASGLCPLPAFTKATASKPINSSPARPLPR